MRPPALFVFAVTASLLLSAIPERAPAAGTDDARLLTELDRSDSEDRRREICQEILRNRPQPYARDFCEGYEALVAGRDAEADQLLEASLAARPDFALACILYGRTVEARGQSERAAAYYRRAIELQPDRTDSRFALGSLLFRRGTTEDPSYLPQALEAFRRMTEEDPASPNGWSSMGAVLAHLGRFADAEEMYRKAIERDRNDPALHDNLAALYLRWGKEEEAQKAWERTLSLNRGYGHAVIELAALHGRSGRLVEAVRTRAAVKVRS